MNADADQGNTSPRWPSAEESYQPVSRKISDGFVRTTRSWA